MRRWRLECGLTFVAMTASQMRIAETIDAFYGDAGAKDGVSRSYKQAVEDLDAETIKALDGPYRYARIYIGVAQADISDKPFSNPSLASVPTSRISMSVSTPLYRMCKSNTHRYQEAQS